MVKKFTIFFLMGIFGLFTTNLFAQEDATINPADILYWIGEGENEVVFIVNWNEPDTALAWGYRFSGETVTVKEMMNKIIEADQRISYTESGWLTDILFNDGNLNLKITDNGYWLFNVNGVMAQVGFEQQTIAGGDYVKWGDTNCGTDMGDYNYVWEKAVTPVSIYENVFEIQYSALSVYPNPAVGETSITFEYAGLNVVSIYDMQGRLVIKETYDANAGENVVISTETMSSGVYFITVGSDRIVQTAKLVVK